MKRRGLRSVIAGGLALLGLCGCAGDGGGMFRAALRPVGPDKLRGRVDKVLRAAVESQDAALRCHALESLAARGGVAASGLIRKRLYDRSAAVRFAAALAAGDVGDYTARHLLEILLRDEDVSVRLAAGYGLEKLGDKRFGGWYDQVLKGKDAKLCGQACMILGKLGTAGERQDSREKLWEVLQREDQVTAVRLQAAEALARLGDKRVVPRLLAYAGSGYADDRMMALSGLELIGGGDALAMLTVLAGDPQVEVRLAAYRALGPENNDETNLAEVRRYLRYKDPQGDETATARVRGLAALALGRIGQEADARLLYEAMEDKLAYVRVAAARGAIDFLQRGAKKEQLRGM